MVLPLYLAMTAAEIRANTDFPPKLSYMACHFSPYGIGLSNCPTHLPEGAMLILNDRTPIHGHDHGFIRDQMAAIVETQKCDSVLLDFQRPDEPELFHLAAKLSETLPCHVGISHWYAKDLDCSVFLPPVLLDTPLSEHLAPWQGRDLWLDVSTENQEITITEKGASSLIIPHQVYPDCHADSALHCHYRIDVGENIRFTLFRTEQDLQDLLAEATLSGISRAVGLYQEWHR